MDTYTYMSGDAVKAIITAQVQSGEKYPMELNSSDFAIVVSALAHAYNSGIAHYEPAGDLLSGIGQTLGVEMI